MRLDRATRERESAFYGGLWGSLGDYGYLHNLTTNQKVAGSSPAERAPKSPANREVLAGPETPNLKQSGGFDRNLTAIEGYLSRLLNRAKAPR